MPKRVLAFAIVSVIVTALASAQESRAWVKVYHPDTRALEAYLFTHGYDVPCESFDPLRHGVDVIVTPPELQALINLGCQIEVCVGFGEDAPPDSRYKTDLEVIQILQNHARNYPAIARAEDLNQTLGLPRTVEGRPIWGLKISDNVAQDEDEEAILIYANEHCRELLCLEVALYAIDQLLQGYGTDPKITAWINAKEIWFVPNLNPDGLAYVWSTNYYWRKNRRPFGSYYGVDLNRNAAFGWYTSCGGSTSPSSDTYKGPSPFSEVETQVLRDLHKREHFAKVCSNHNYGREVLYPARCSESGIPPAINAYLKALDVTMAGKMSYANRYSSAEGEGYQWCYQWNGAFAMLIESGTSFQPAWTAVDPEVKRVWPGFQWLIDLPIPLQGHVTNRYTGYPVRADIAVAGFTYGNGETRFSEPVFGRYHYFMPAGNYSLTFTADGYKPRTINNVSVAASGNVLDVQMEPSAFITVAGTPRVGNTLTLSLSAPGNASKPYAMHAALTTSPPIDLGHGDVMPLGPDFLFFISPYLTTIFKDYYGILNSTAGATAQVVIPVEPGVVGLTIHQAFATIDHSQPNHIGHVSAPASFKITS